MSLQPVALKRTVLGLLSDTFRSLRHRNYRLFFYGQLISLIGTWLQNTALAWLVYSLTKDAMTLGVMSFLASIPVLFLSVIAGTVADEYPKRRLLVITQILSGIQALLLAVAIWTSYTSIFIIGLANLILGIITAFDLPTRQAFVVDMASKEDVTNAVALNSAIFNAARLLGPALAGYLLAQLSTYFSNLDSLAICFVLNGISYIAVIVGLLMMQFDKDALPPRYEREGSRIAAMKEGLQYLNGIPQLRSLMLLVVVMTLFGWSYTVNLPIIAGETLHGGSSTYGALLAANGVGALLAALSQAALGTRFAPRKMVFAGIAAFCIEMFAIGQTHTQWIAMLILVVLGWGIVTFFITANTTLQRQAPDALRGRVMSIYSLAFAGLYPFGSLLIGWLASTYSVRTSFQINAAILLICSIPVYFYVQRLPQLTFTTEEDFEHLVTSEQALVRAEQISRG